jgi:TPR repeat protein
MWDALTQRLGVRKNQPEAARWYRMAAEQGDPAAQNALAILKATGRGSLRDPDAALDLFRRAATSGYPPAQLNLAAAFDHSHLVPHDPLRAYIWYSIAARLASDKAVSDEAARGRDRLAQKSPSPRSKRHAPPRDPGSQEARTPTKEWRHRGK